MTRSISLAAMAMALTACADPTLVSRGSSPDSFTPGLTAPADAQPGSCWDKTESPAEIRTISEDVLVQPAKVSDTGTIQSPPVYRSETRQVIVKERDTRWFQLVCAETMTPDYITSVQRALQIRGFYTGPETGRMDSATKGALRRYQVHEQIDVPDPGRLSVEAARRIGLWTVDRSV